MTTRAVLPSPVADGDASGGRPTRRQFVARLATTLALAAVPRSLRAADRTAGGRGDAGAVLVLALADLHSAHERYAPLLARIDRVLAASREVPALIAVNGDLFERGNVVALRGGGRLDLAFITALRRRAPVVFNLGNHEGALVDLREAVRRLRAAGAVVVSNVRDRASGRPLAEAVAVVRTRGRRVAVVGMGTDDLATYRAAVRGEIEVPDSAGYAGALLPTLPALRADFHLLLSHDGVTDDRRTLATLPDGSLLVGAHDHLRFAHRQGRTLYVHTGFWGEAFSVIGGTRDGDATTWTHRAVDVPPGGPVDAEFERRVRVERARHLRAEDQVVIGRTRRALPAREAALLAVAAVRDAAGCDAALVGNTTFGAGLPAGAITRHDFDAFVRFDGAIVRADIDGATLRRVLAGTNQLEDTPFERRRGEFLFATPVPSLDDARTYAVAVNAYAVSDAARAGRLLGTATIPSFAPVRGLALKAVVAARLARPD